MKDSNNLKGLLFVKQERIEPQLDHTIKTHFRIDEPMLDYTSVIEKYKKEYEALSNENVTFEVKPAILIITEKKNESNNSRK